MGRGRKQGVCKIKSKSFHPHPAFGHLLLEGGGIERDALGQAPLAGRRGRTQDSQGSMRHTFRMLD
ncbi:hypothetical protein OAL17_00770 [bacterium]|nr:hypothetical protein [bacterium]